MRTNLIKNPSFEVDTTGYWSGARVTTEAYVGSASLQLTAGALNTRLTGYGANSNATANADAIPVSPNEVITFSAFVKAASSPGPSIRLKIHWFNASGAWISDSDSAAVTIGTTWTRLSITGLAPTNAAKFGVVIFDWFGGTGGTIYTDGWLAEKSPFADTYFDGSTTGVANYTHAWTGTAHASSSTATSTGTRTNLLPNPSFETNTTGWNLVSTGSVGSSTATSGNPFAYSGTKYGSGSGPWISDKLPATAGLAYTASAWWSRAAGARNGGVFLHFYDAANVELSPPTTSEAAINQADVPQRFASGRIAPAGTTQVAVRLQATSITAVDAVLLEQSPYLDTYFDGSTVATTYTHAWTGTAHASTSTQVPGAPTGGTLVTVKSRESGAWVSRPAVPRYRSNGVWKIGNPKRWNGTAWVDLN